MIQYPDQTQFYYGKDVQENVGTMLQSRAQKVLVLYGIEALRDMHWYHQIQQSLQGAGIPFVEFGGIAHQAELEQIETGIALCKKEQVDFILAVGGGSVIDSAKAIAMGAVCDQCIWTYFTTDKQPVAALPLGLVLTIPGSGSENNNQAMIANDDTLLKLCCRSAVLQPQFCLVNPEIFYTVPQKQLAHAVVMILNRLVSDYLLQLHHGQDDALQAKLEQRIKMLMRTARRLQYNRFDDQAWTELVLLDIHKNLSMERDMEEDSCQRMAAELSAMYEVPYGAVLAVLLPAWMRFISDKNQREVLTFCQNVMGVAQGLSPQEQVEEGLRCLQQFFTELQLSNSLCELGIEAFCFKNVAQICTGYGWGQERPSGVLQTLYWQDLYQIYQSVYEHPMQWQQCLA